MTTTRTSRPSSVLRRMRPSTGRPPAGGSAPGGSRWRGDRGRDGRDHLHGGGRRGRRRGGGGRRRGGGRGFLDLRDLVLDALHVVDRGVEAGALLALLEGVLELRWDVDLL